MSPILYLFYNADLIEACKTDDTEAVGYIDDVSILAIGPSAPSNCKTLKRIHAKAEDWATKHGSKFAPAKYELVHFTRDPRANSTHALPHDYQGLPFVPISRYPHGYQAPMGLPSGTRGSKSHEATVGPVGSGVVDVGNRHNQPATGV